jgi:ribosomal protein S18 acetylase RimI-like enzyme
MDVMLYRNGVFSDLPQLQQLAVVSYGQYQSVLTPENWKILETNINNQQMLADLMGKATTFVCEHEGAIVGMAYIVPSGNPTDIFEPEWSYIRMVGVNPAYTGRGIAKTLTRMCLGHAIHSKEHVVALHTSEFMDAARHIYESLGFAILKEIPPKFGKKYWLYTLHI